MKEITINRATFYGVLECTGELFEYNGIQFCLTNLDGDFYAIEVLSGMSAYHIEYSHLYTELGNKRKLRKWIRENIHLFTPELIERIKKDFKRQGMKYPLNKKIIE